MGRMPNDQDPMTNGQDLMTDTPSTPTDSDLPPVEIFCMKCDYNLTGCVSERCPECGEPFDRARLTYWASAPYLPMALLYHSLGSSPATDVFWATLFKPALVGRQLPPGVNPMNVRDYSWSVRILGAAVIPALFAGLLTIVYGYPPIFVGALLCALPIAIVSWFCEEILAALFAVLIESRAVAPHNQHAFWRALCRAFSSYLLIHSLLFLSFAMVMMFVHTATFTLIVPLAMLAWWSAGLGRAISARSTSSDARVLAARALIPVVGICSAFLGFVLLRLMIWVVDSLF